MDIDLPDVIVEVKAAFASYEKALVENDVAAMQTWVRFEEGWRIVAAHVSVIDEPRQ